MREHDEIDEPRKDPLIGDPNDAPVPHVAEITELARGVGPDDDAAAAYQAAHQAAALVDAGREATALYGFAGWLTCRREAVTFGATHGAARPAELVAEFIEAQGWAPPPERFTDSLKPYPVEPEGTPWGVATEATQGDGVVITKEALNAIELLLVTLERREASVVAGVRRLLQPTAS